ncbi:outer membrane protein assembly factor BamB family protein [Amycolatopsis pittospori]|uniref:outer membrane protein assembly factor BamB family protein n=1 Tax=Amycolatopsis pittospori TaxID=2749434 RepID=UPI0015F0DD19|nr:PQQ-binding-like beta-propeller repeat protein [Amycolatopsis pittospori]
MTRPTPPGGGQWPPQQPWQPQQHQGWQQPQPYPQQQYGPPPQGPPPPPPKGKKFLFWLVPLVVAVVAAAVIVPIALSGDGDAKQDQAAQTSAAPGASGGSAKTKWELSGAKDVPEYKHGITTWLHEEDLVVVRDQYVAAFTRADGKQRWLAKAPDGKVFCGTGVEPVAGKIVLAFGKAKADKEDGSCDNATLLDLKDGKFGWQVPMAVPQKMQDRVVSVEAVVTQIMGDVVFVTADQGYAALDLATGAIKWTKTFSRKADGEDTCAGQDMMPRDGKVVVAVSCVTGDFSVTAMQIDPATGNVEMEDSVPHTGYTISGIGLLSVKPVLIHGANTEEGTYFLFDDNMKLKSKIDGGKPNSEEELDGASSQGFGHSTSGTEHHPSAIIVEGDTFYTPTRTIGGQVNALVAVDLNTGQRKWKASVPEGTIQAPIKIVDGQILAQVGPLYNTGPQRTVKIAVADGKVTPFLEAQIRNSEQDETGPIPGFFRYLWADDRVYAVAGKWSNLSVDVFLLQAE